jgi:hypothetical protein
VGCMTACICPLERFRFSEPASLGSCPLRRPGARSGNVRVRSALVVGTIAVTVKNRVLKEAFLAGSPSIIESSDLEYIVALKVAKLSSAQAVRFATTDTLDSKTRPKVLLKSRHGATSVCWSTGLSSTDKSSKHLASNYRSSETADI